MDFFSFRKVMDIPQEIIRTEERLRNSLFLIKSSDLSVSIGIAANKKS